MHFLAKEVTKEELWKQEAGGEVYLMSFMRRSFANVSSAH
jgi:hypothetical protein